MSESLSTLAAQLRALLSRGETLASIERFYAPDVLVFENRQLARSGRDACLAYEREALAKQPEPVRFNVRSMAVNEADGVVFFEQTLRFVGPDQRPMRIDQVAVQRWHRGLISEERF